MRLDRITMLPEILSRLQDILLLRAADGSILDANPAALSTYGYSIAQITALQLGDLEAPQPPADSDAGQRDTAEGDGVCNAIHRRTDGSYFPVEVVSVPVVIDGQPALLMIIHDTSELEHCEDTLRESKAVLQTIIDNSPLPMYVTDLDGRFTLVNRKLETLVGSPGETLVGKSGEEFLSEAGAEKHRANDRTIVATRLPVSFQESNDEPDGRHIYLSTKFPLLGSNGDVVSVGGVSLDVTNLERAETDLAESNARFVAVVKDAASILGRIVAARDPYTQSHEIRVAELAMLIAIEMGLSDHEIQGAEMAGLVHDIGKMSVPAEILSKPGTLTAEQVALVRCHPRDGYEILKGVEFPWPVADAILQHHERMDGSGYPHGLLGDDICAFARILAVADVVEAISSHRPYRPALGADAAAAEIAEHPEKYDQLVAAAFLAVYESGRMPW